MNFKSFKFFAFITILFTFNEAYAALECVQSTDSSGQTGFFVQDGTTIYNGKNGTAIKRCGMSRRDQGTQQFQPTAAPPAPPKVGSVSSSNIANAELGNINFVVPTGVNATGAIVTLYAASSIAGPYTLKDTATNLQPGSSYSSPVLTPGTYYKANVQFLNGGTKGADVTVLNAFKFTLCNGEAVCNLTVAGGSAGNGSFRLASAGSDTLDWSAVVDPSVYTGTGSSACVVLDNRVADKPSISGNRLRGSISLGDWQQTWNTANPPVGTARAPGLSWNPNLQVRLIDRNPDGCVKNTRAAVGSNDGIQPGAPGFGTQTSKYEYTKSIAKQVNFKTF